MQGTYHFAKNLPQAHFCIEPITQNYRMSLDSHSDGKVQLKHSLKHLLLCSMVEDLEYQVNSDNKATDGKTTASKSLGSKGIATLKK